MKTFILPIFALALMAFASPAAACQWMDKSDEQTTEKPTESTTS